MSVSAAVLNRESTEPKSHATRFVEPCAFVIWSPQPNRIGHPPQDPMWITKTSVSVDEASDTTHDSFSQRHADGNSGGVRITAYTMKIVHFIDHLDLRRGGPAGAVVALATAMAERSHSVVVTTTTARDVPTSWGTQPRAPRCVELPVLRTRLLSPEAKAQLRELIKGADVVHLHGVWEPSNAQVARIARQLRVPYMISLRGMLDDWSMDQRWLKKRVYWFFSGKRYLERAAAVHCTAKLELKQSKKWFPLRLGRVLYNLMDLRQFDSMPGPEAARLKWPALATEAPKLLFLSRMSSKKGLEHLIEAAAILTKQAVAHNAMPPVVIVAGTGDEAYEAECKKLVKKLNLDSTVHFVGHVGGVEKISLLQACDLFVLPTSQENFGFVFFEALAAGLPVVTTNLIDTAGEIEDSGAGFIVEQSANAIAKACELALAEGQALRERGKAGRAWTFEHLNSETSAAAFESLYKEYSQEGVDFRAPLPSATDARSSSDR